jgi:hypothetical protein
MWNPKGSESPSVDFARKAGPNEAFEYIVGLPVGGTTLDVRKS